MQKSIYIITGPPRSGLTLLSNCLQLIGLQPQGREQEEDTINRLLLQDLQVTEFTPALPVDWLQTKAADSARDRIKKLLSDNSYAADFLIIRNSLVLRLWHDSLKDLDFKIKYILIIRHPSEVSLSMLEHNNLDLNQGHILWLAHTRAVLRATEEMYAQQKDSDPDTVSSLPASHLPLTAIITFDQLLANPVSTLGTCLSSFSQLTVNNSLLTNGRSLLDYVQPSLKHHHAGDLPEADKEAFKPYAKLYDQIRAQHTSTRKISLPRETGVPSGVFHRGEDSPAPPAGLNQAQPDCEAKFNLVNRLEESSPQGIQPGWTQTSSSDLIDSLLQALSQDASRFPLTTSHIAHDSSRFPRDASHLLTAKISILSAGNTWHTETFPMIANQWQKLSFPVHDPGNQQLTIKPLNTYGTVSIASIALMNRATGEEVLRFENDGIDVQGTAVRLPDKDNLVLLVTGEEPLLQLPAVSMPECPLEVVVWVKPSINVNQIKETLQSHVAQSMPTLQRLYSQHEGKVSDKWDLYLIEYDKIFKDYRNSPVSLLEIGVQNGGSIEIWSKYFPKARTIVGCDVLKKCAELVFNNPKISIIIGDANTDEVHKAITSISKKYDIIIDDGSHSASNIVRSFAKYFPLLTYEGIYVVEDLHTSYWKQYHGGLFYPYSSMQFFKHLLDIINCEHWGVDKSESQLLNGFFQKYDFVMNASDLKTIHSINFLNSLCVIRKSHPENNNLGKRYIAGKAEKITSNYNSMHRSDIQKRDESNNKWANRQKPPGEELLEAES